MKKRGGTPPIVISSNTFLWYPPINQPFGVYWSRVDITPSETCLPSRHPEPRKRGSTGTNGGFLKSKATIWGSTIYGKPQIDIWERFSVRHREFSYKSNPEMWAIKRRKTWGDPWRLSRDVANIGHQSSITTRWGSPNDSELGANNSHESTKLCIHILDCPPLH